MKTPSAALLTVACLVCVAPWPAAALIMTGTGNRPVPDAGWPDGALAVANLEARTGWWEGPPFGGGEWHFIYHGGTAALGEALTAFAAIRAPVLEVVLHDGPGTDTFIKGPVDWAFTVWVPANWHRLYNNPKSSGFFAGSPNFHQPAAPPHLDVYLGGADSPDWSKLKPPANLRLRDERASAATVQPVGGGLFRADVYDMATGKTVVGARLILSRDAEPRAADAPGYEKIAEALTDASGRAEIQKIPSGNFRFSVLAEGYAPRLMGYGDFDARTFRQITVELAGPATLEGMVIDGEGKPIKGAKVQTAMLLGLDGRAYVAPDEPWAETNAAGAVVLRHRAETDAAGHFILTGLPTGYATLRAEAPRSYYTDYSTIFETPGTNAVLHLPAGGSIHVEVTDRGGHPVVRVEGNPVLVTTEGGPTIGSWGGGATVGADGTCEFKPVPPGEYRINSRPNPSTSNKAYATEQRVSVVAGQVTRVHIIYE